jgi:hypothetical protein
MVLEMNFSVRAPPSVSRSDGHTNGCKLLVARRCNPTGAALGIVDTGRSLRGRVVSGEQAGGHTRESARPFGWPSHSKTIRTGPGHQDDVRRGKEPSIWAVMASRDLDLGGLLDDSRWQSPQIRSDEAMWTDGFSNIIEHRAVLHQSRTSGK